MLPYGITLASRTALDNDASCKYCSRNTYYVDLSPFRSLVGLHIRAFGTPRLSESGFSHIYGLVFSFTCKLKGTLIDR